MVLFPRSSHVLPVLFLRYNLALLQNVFFKHLFRRVNSIYNYNELDYFVSVLYPVKTKFFVFQGLLSRSYAGRGV